VLKGGAARVADLETEAYAVYLACRDPRVPWPPMVVAALVAAYALSPIDLIPDFIPVIGFLDDLVLLPMGLALAIRLIPAEVLAEHRIRARETLAEHRPHSGLGLAIVVAVWLVVLLGAASVARTLIA